MMFCLGEAVHSTYRHNVSYRDLGACCRLPATRTVW